MYQPKGDTFIHHNEAVLRELEGCGVCFLDSTFDCDPALKKSIVEYAYANNDENNKW